MKTAFKCTLFFLASWFFIHQSTAQTGSLQKDSTGMGQISSPVKIITDTVKERLNKTGNATQTGMPGIGMGVRLTGTSLLNTHSKPLIVVNGISYGNIATSGFDFTTADERDYAALINMSPEDIQEITITNEGTSISQYGSSAANGVILITTKRGKKGKPVFSYRYEGSVLHQPKGYEVLNGSEYTMLMKQALYNNRKSEADANVPELNYDPSFNLYYNYNQNTDWLKAITRIGLTHDHYFSAFGGGKKLVYHISAGYLTKQGVTLGTEQKCFNTRLTMDHTITDRWKLSVEMGYTYSSTDINFQREGTMPLQELALKKMSNMSIYKRHTNGNATSDYFVPSINFQGDGYTWYNPVATASLAGDNTKQNLLTSKFKSSYQLLKNLVYDSYLSFSTSNNKRSISDPNLITDPFSLDIDKAVITDNEVGIVRTHNQLTFMPQLNNKHSVIVTALFNTYAQSAHTDNENFENSVLTGASSSDVRFKSNYSVLRGNYQFMKKYVLDISGMMEGTSTDGCSFDHQFYPSATVKWIASNENFVKTISFLNDLTLKASYAKFGNSFVVYQSAHPKESHVQKDVGANVSLLKSKLNVGVLLYNKKINNHITRSYLSMVGPNEFVLAYTTVDEVNRGWELIINANIFKNNNLAMDFSLNLYRNRTLTDHQYQTDDPTSGESYIRKVEANEPFGAIYGYHFQGVYVDDQDAIAKDKNGNVIYDNNGAPIYSKFNSTYIFKGGDAKYADINYDGVINSSDLIYLGDANPYFTGSGGPSFRYKGFWLGIYFNFRLHNKIINVARMSLEDMTGKSNQSIAVLNRWRAPGMEANIPRACLNNPVNGLGSDRFVEDGSFMRLKAITMKYQFSKTLVKKMHLQNLEFYFTGNNLLTFTHYTGADPEIWLYNQGSSIGTDNNYTPMVRTFTMGINVGF